jgi:hypothetical protein
MGSAVSLASGLSRSVVFALAGVLFFVFWAVARPSFEMTPSMGEWPHVL